MAQAGRSHRINAVLDQEHAARLRRVAENSHTAEGTLARSLLSRAIDEESFRGLGRERAGGGYDGLRFVLGPWRRMVVGYEYTEADDIVGVLTVQDARSSTTATTFRA
jgi:hypothetical protein